MVEGGSECGTHSSVIHRHEDGVDDDANSDEHVDERIHYEQFNDVSKAMPT